MLSRKQVLRQAWPIILANASTPFLGLVDTAVIGQTGSTQALGALAICNLIFNFLYWALGFLRMGTTGFVSQAQGRASEREVFFAAAHSIGIGCLLGIAIITCQAGLAAVAILLIQGSDPVEQLALDYFWIRIWGAPATLCLFAIQGLFIGQGKSRYLLFLQVSLNGLNIILDILFAGVFGWGVKGIAAGTLIAEYSVCLMGIGLLYRQFRPLIDAQPLKTLLYEALNINYLLTMLRVNGDLFIRTLLMLLGFAWFTNQSALYGDITLAANHILLQLISFSAFFLDGFAFVAESKIGHAIGKKSRAQFWLAIRYTSEWAVVTAALLALGLWLGGGSIIAWLTDIQNVQSRAEELLPWAVLYITFSVGAFQLDGIFIGATASRAMRNASFQALAVFAFSWFFLHEQHGVHGLWASFLIYVVARALTLLFNFKHLSQKLENTTDLHP